MREYETVFVLHPKLEEGQVEEEIEAVKKTIEASEGSVIDIERWGKRKLAYEVRKVNEGIYTLIRFRSDVKVLQDLERRYRLREEVIRHLTVVAQGPPPERPARQEVTEETTRSAPGSEGNIEEPRKSETVESKTAVVQKEVGESPATTSTSEAAGDQPAEPVS